MLRLKIKYGRSWRRGKHDQNIPYEKNLFSIKKKTNFNKKI